MKKKLTSGYWAERLQHIASASWYAEVMPLTFARARIIITDGLSVENGW